MLAIRIAILAGFIETPAPIRSSGIRSRSPGLIRLCLPPPDSKTSSKMTDADKIVAATFAVARCGGLGHSKPEDYIAEYDGFLRLLNEREATAELAEKDALPSPWKFDR